MAEFEHSTENVSEGVGKAPETKKATGEAPRWDEWVSHSMLILGLLSAVGVLLANITAQEALFERTHEILEDSVRERDLITIDVLEAKHAILAALGKVPDETEVREIRELEVEIAKIEKTLASEEAHIRTIADAHHILAIGVTLLAMAVVLSSISIVLKRLALWIGGLAVGAVGIGYLGVGIVKMLY